MYIRTKKRKPENRRGKSSKKIKYTAIVLNESSRKLLLKKLKKYFDERMSWEYYKVKDQNSNDISPHHMTLGLKKLKDLKNEHPTYNKYIKYNNKGKKKKYTLIATHIGITNFVMAVKISGHILYNIDNKGNITKKTPHITLAVNRKNRGKPMMSNHIEKWEKLNKKIILEGYLEEIY